MITITLLLQIGHFLIAYFLLDHLLLRIAVKKVQQEEHIVALLQQNIAALHHEINAATTQQEDEWQYMQQTLSAQKPPQAPGSFLVPERAYHPEIAPIAPQAVDELVHVLKRHIVERLARD